MKKQNSDTSKPKK
jgi:hypothetical protein